MEEYWPQVSVSADNQPYFKVSVRVTVDTSQRYWRLKENLFVLGFPMMWSAMSDQPITRVFAVRDQP